MTEEDKDPGNQPSGNAIRARMFLITMLVLFGATVGLLVYAYFRAGPPPS